MAKEVAGGEPLDVMRTRFSLAAEAARIGIWDWDLQTDEMTYSERAKEIFGFPANGSVTIGQVRAATHPQDQEWTAAAARRALDPAVRAKEPYEYRIVRCDGETRWVLAYGEAVFGSGADGVDVAQRYVGTIQDITERKLTEQALQQSEARLRLALDAGRMAVWEFDAADGSVTRSPELHRLLGFPPDTEATLEEIRRGYPPGERERMQAAGAAAVAKGERFFEVEYRYVRPSGEECWLQLRAEILFGQDGAPTGAIGVLVDITGRKLSEASLRETEGRLQALAGNLPNGMIYQIEVDANGPRFTFVSESCERLNGTPAEAVLADPDSLYKLIDPAFLPALDAAEKHSLATGAAFEFECPMGPDPAARRWFRISSAPRRMDDGRVVWDGIQIDIHDRKLAEERLQEALNQQTVLFRELSHRVANGFQIMSSLLTLQGRALNEPNAVAALNAAAERVQAMGLVHRRLYRSGGALGRQDLGAFLSELISDLDNAYVRGATRHQVHKRIETDAQVAPDLAVTVGMIAAELVINATKHAYPDGQAGPIRVTCTGGADEIELRVEDEGKGLPEGFDLEARTGQGMLVATSQARQLGGRLQFERRTPGTAFFVRFGADAG